MDFDLDYKTLHERFVSNHNGTSPGEIVLISATIPLSVVFVASAAQFLHLNSAGPLTNFIVETIITSLPILFVLTCCGEFVEIFMFCFATVVILVFLISQRSSRKPPKYAIDGKKLQEFILPQSGRFGFVTNYRSSMLLVTTVCILAVDFPVFPRRFAKAEDFGFGLMDIGVGSFVFAGGLTSQEARKGSAVKQSWHRYLRKSLSSALPMLIFGLVRFISVKSTGYHEHVTEYGVHWNFFLTLAVTKVLSSFLFVVIPPEWSWILSILLGLGHQAILNHSLSAWVMSDIPRTDFITANREGIVSSMGYVAIYIAGVSWGHQLMNVMQPPTFERGVKEMTLWARWALTMWASLIASQESITYGPPSRRLANWGYFNWMVAYNLTLLTFFLGCDLFLILCAECKFLATPGGQSSSSGSARHGNHRYSKGKPKRKISSPPPVPVTPDVSTPSSLRRMPELFEAISYNALVYFLLANLLTGLVNISIQTIHVTSCPAVLILAAYLLVVNGWSVILYRLKIQTKFW